MAAQYGFMERIADVFKRHEIVLDMIATSEVSVALTTSWGSDLQPVVEELSPRASLGRSAALIRGEELTLLGVLLRVLYCQYPRSQQPKVRERGLKSCSAIARGN